MAAEITPPYAAAKVLLRLANQRTECCCSSIDLIVVGGMCWGQERFIIDGSSTVDRHELAIKV